MTDIALFRGEPNQRTLRAGDVLFDVGDPAVAMYAVLSGEIEILVTGQVVERVAEGGMFGEVALLGDRRRTASARASLDTTLAVVDEARFLALVRMNPYFALEVMRLLAWRLERRTPTGE